jgi:hypothetical protein
MKPFADETQQAQHLVEKEGHRADARRKAGQFKGMKLLLIPFLLLPLGGCLDPLNLSDLCDNEIIQQISSPDGRWKAVVFQRDCGATTGFSSQISVIGAGSSLPNDGGNIFVADDNHGLAPSGPGGGPKVWVRWLSSSHLKIAYDRRDRTFATETQYQGLSISYQKK